MTHAGSSDPVARRKLADTIRDACIRVGFFYIKNHGIPSSVPEAAIQSSLPFFELPIEEKMKYDIHASDNFKGYNALMSENTDPEGRGDLNEGFNFGWEPLEGDQSADNPWMHTTGSMGGPNVWPEGGADMKEFRKAMLTYYHAAVRLGLQLFPLLALALDLPENFFADKTTKPAAIMRILHYPPQFGPVDDRVIGIGAHTEYVFTILYQQDDIPALQVLNSAGQWIQAKPIPGTLVVNLGDQLARWTNDIFKSTVHRAINRSGVRRYSIPLFFGTDYDVTIEALPSCVSPEHPAKYEAVKAGDYVKSRLNATYAQSKSS
ncbi:Clavaminate synthase-like protein [Serendipita vermifera]|nr:Clavaminate synthase-like protein [Serendipita vermifera]